MCVVGCRLQEEVMLYSNASGSVMLRIGLDFNKEKDNSETGLDYNSIMYEKETQDKTCKDMLLESFISFKYWLAL